MPEQDGLTIVSVERSPTRRGALARVLRRAGWTVLEADSGDEALRLARDGPDLVIADDPDVCRRIKSDPDTCAIPVLQTAGAAADPGLDSGADAWLPDPAAPAEIVATARALVRLRRIESRVHAAARQWRSMFDAISDAVCLLSPGGTVLRCNRAFATLLERPYGAIVERPLAGLMPALAERMSAGHATATAVELAVGARWLRVRIDPAPFDDPTAPRVCIIADVTARRAAEDALREQSTRSWAVAEHHDRIERLQTLSSALAGAVSRAEVAALVLREGVSTFGAVAGGVAAVSEDGRELELLHATGVPETLLAAWRRFPVDARTMMAEALRARRPVFVATWQERVARYPHQSVMRLEGGDGAAVAIPLLIEPRVVGVLGLAFAASRTTDPAEAAFMMSVGQQCAQALERARLYDTERRRAAQLQSLAAAAVAINGSLSAEEILAVVTDQARTILGAQWCVTSLTAGAEPPLLTAVSRSEQSGAWRDYHERPGTPELHALVLEHGHPVRRSRRELEAMPAWRESPEAVREHGPMQGWMAAPLVATDGRHLGIIQVADTPGGAFSALDEAILVQLAQMTSVAVESSRLYHRARAAEEQLRADAAELERAVGARTAELSASNERLAEMNLRLAEMNAQLEAFSHNVAHNLRAPLRGVVGHLDALLEDHAGGLPAGAREHGERIRAAARHMDALIGDLLDWSRLDRAEIQRTPVHLADVIADALARNAEAIEQAGAEVTVGVPPGLPTVNGHHAMLVQALEHLIVNGLKFVTPGTRARLHVEAVAGPAGVGVSVTDSGIGIAPQHFERIFQPFERLHRQDTYPGTGVGLAIARRAVERLGGRVGVSSRPGHGSRFWFELPTPESEQ
jgi:signal transduction histidine kinase/CheY-like chemotaxis protein